ncbi:unnamed protein product [Peronospora effusa]|nr:unnamed protein product [Peronospora effusa]
MSVLVQALRQKMKKMASLREHGFYYVNGLVAMFYFANRSSKVTYSSSEHRAAIGKVDEDNTMKRSSPASIRNEIGSTNSFQLQKQSRMKIYYTKACCLKSARKDRMHHYRGRLETNLVMESLLILTY